MTNEEIDAMMAEIALIDWVDEDEEEDDYVPPVRNRHITSADEWDSILK